MLQNTCAGPLALERIFNSKVNGPRAAGVGVMSRIIEKHVFIIGVMERNLKFGIEGSQLEQGLLE